jgi:transcriptional regulator with XRE-family HTH domain
MSAMPKTHATAEIRPDWKLGSIVRTLREDKRISMRDAASRCHISGTTWSVLETGYGFDQNSERIERRPAATTVIAAAQLLGADPLDWLRIAGLDDKIRVDGVSVDLAVTNPAPDVKAIVAKIRALSDEQQAHVSAVVDAFAAVNELAARPKRARNS